MKHCWITIFIIFIVAHLTFAQSSYFAGTGTFDPYALDDNDAVTILSAPSNDALSTWQTLPFNFIFYGSVMTGYYASDNGYITFDNGASTSVPSNDTLPLAALPNNAIYALWDDLELNQNTATSDEIRAWTYGNAPNRVHVIQWFSVTKKGGDTNDYMYFAILLYECGGFDIVHNWKSLSSLGLTATIGCENVLGTLGTLVNGSPAIDFPSVTNDNTDDVVYHFYDSIAPQFDASIIFLEFPYYADTVSNVAVKGIIQNRGSIAITSVDISYRIDSAVTNTTVPLFIPPGGAAKFNQGVPFILSDTGTIAVKVWITDVNGSQDEVACNDTAIGSIIGIDIPDSTVRRISLIEEVTQWNSFPCASQNPGYNLILSDSSFKVAPIAYHGYWPDPDDDPFYQFNKIDNQKRIDYYRVDGVPTAFINGLLIEGISYEGAPSNLTHQMIQNYYKQGSLFKIDISENVTGITDNLQVTIEALIDVPFPDMTIYIVITEELGSYISPAGLNGETDFPYVMRFMIPDGDGIAMGKHTAGQKTTIIESYALDPAFNRLGMRTLVFIQENISGEILQAAKTNTDPGFSTVNDITGHSTDLQLRIFPSITDNVTNIQFYLPNTEEVEIKVYNMLGEAVLHLWNGKVQPGVKTIRSDVSSLTNGIYLVELKAGNSRAVQRITRIGNR